ncbi:MAG TPA: hypothetical protein VFF52_14135, partial [Isosphaeraceae bacterium]|nr:hypothetical protein [Isosphaeraceae bacterium]
MGADVRMFPNLVAAFLSFLCLFIAAKLGWRVAFALVDVGNLSTVLLPAGWIDTAFVAAAGSMLFLVIGLIIQLWQHHRKFDDRWPMVLAFPTAWALFLPEALVGGSSLVFWLLVEGTAVALVFCIHWRVLSAVREAMD